MTRNRAKRTHLRLFVALEVPAEVRRLTSAWGREIARGSNAIRAVPPPNIHVTLAFLGDRPPAEVPLIARAIEATGPPATGEATGPPELELGAPVLLPRRRPRAIALAIHDDTGWLGEFQSDLAESLGEAIGWRPERAFHPHLTAARLGRANRAEGLDLPVSPALGFAPESVSLILSRLAPEGVEYEALATVSLPGPDRPGGESGADRISA